MPASWACTSDAALQSRPAPFGSGAKAFDAAASDLEDVAGRFGSELDGSWSGFEGDFSAGIGALGRLIGLRATEMAGHADTVAGAYRTCESGLESLEVTSDALLTDSEELLVERDSAETSRVGWQIEQGVRWRARRDHEEEGTPGWVAATDHWHAAVTEKRADERTRDDREADLDANQREFDELREAEEDTHQSFADVLDGIDLMSTAVEIDLSGVEAESVELLITYLDALVLSADGGRAGGYARGFATSAREVIARLTGVDTEEHERIVDIVEARREIERLGPDELALMIADALAAGDEDELQRLAELLALGLMGMTDETKEAIVIVLKELLVTFGDGSAPLINLFVLYEGELPDEIAVLVFELAEMDTFFIDDIEMQKLIAARLGLDWTDPDLYDQVLLHLFRRLKDQDGNGFYDFFLDGGYENPIAAQVAFEFLVENPELVRTLVNGNSEELQDVLEVLGRADLSDDDWTGFVEAYASRYPLAEDLANPDLSDEEAWGNFGERIGNLQAQIAEIGGDRYDPGSFATFVLKTGIGFLPGGSAINTGLSGLQALANGYEPDTTYERLGIEAAADLNRQLIIMGQMSHLDSDFAETVDAELVAARNELVADPDRTGPPTQDEIVERMMQTDSTVVVRIKHRARMIEGSRADGTDGI